MRDRIAASENRYRDRNVQYGFFHVVDFLEPAMFLSLPIANRKDKRRPDVSLDASFA
jgi:hypothetical protein